MSYSADRWETIQRLFAELSELSGAACAARLDQIAAGDPALQQELAGLLAASESVGDRFEGPPDPLPDPEPLEPLEGRRVGPYRLLREVGRGGMGTVYEARRDDAEFAKRVAVKMVARGRDSDAILRRFRHERRILARLEHRNIAALLDGGVTPEGQPYFAMEYVEGERIDRYCDAHGLGLEARLQLFRQVCTAVHYAHRNLVVHRDLKPSNILVAADGTVKLLDFGIAKLIESSDDSDDPLTQTGLAPMTTAYASPEQRAGEPVTTASDIYSLGVLLRELLVGREGGKPPVPELPPDLANIIDKALREEPDRRYASAESLGDDLRRFLAGEPVQATPDSVGYRVRRFVSRNRLVVAASAVAFAAVLVGSGLSVWQARAARRERDRAEQERAKATQLTDFFRSVFLAASPVRMGREVTVAEAIDAAIPRVDSAFGRPDQGPVRQALKATLATTLFEMGFPAKALPLAEAAMNTQLAADSGRITLDATNSIYDLAGIEADLGHFARAESLFRVAMARFEQLPEMSAVDRARGYGQLALVVSSQGRLEESLSLQRRTVALLRAGQPPSDRALRVALANLGADLTEIGRLEEGEKYLRESADLAARYDGPERDELSRVLQPLAVNLLYAGRVAEAESVARRSYRIAVANRGADNPSALSSLRALLNVLVARGACDEAIERARAVIALRGHGLPDTEPSLGSAYQALGQCLADQGHADLGEAALKEAVTLREAVFPATHWAVGYARFLLGEVMVRNARRQVGEPLLKDGYRTMVTALGATHPRCREAKARLDRLAVRSESW